MTTEFRIRRQVRYVEDGIVDELDFAVPRDLAYFAGHFEGWPVLPAVAQLAALVVPQVARLYPELGRLRRAARLKFSRPIAPGDELRLRIHVRTDERLKPVRAGEVRFTLAREGEVVSSGVLEYEVPGA